MIALSPSARSILRPQALGPRLAAEQPELELQRLGSTPASRSAWAITSEYEGVATSTCAPRSLQQHRLARGLPARHGNHGGADPLAALVEAEPAGEQAVAVGVVDQHPRPDAGHRHRARHQLGPGLEVRARVADDGGLAVAAARGLDAHDLLARNREQPERIVLAQVALVGERDVRQVVEGCDVVGTADACLREPLCPERLALSTRCDGRAQPLELERGELLARHRLRRGVPDRRSEAAAVSIPVLLEVVDERRTQVAVGLLARVRGHVLAEQVERLLADPHRGPVRDALISPELGQRLDPVVDRLLDLVRARRPRRRSGRRRARRRPTRGPKGSPGGRRDRRRTAAGAGWRRRG